MTARRFLRDARAGATAIVAAAVAVMAVGGTALIGDHAWLVDQRDALKTASDAAGIAATVEMDRVTEARPDISDDELKIELKKVARRYVELNLAHLPADRFEKATRTLVVTVEPRRSLRTVDVSVEADLGGTLLAKHLPMIGDSVEPGAMRAQALVESVVNPIEVVLAIDVSQSMKRNLTGGGDNCSTVDECLGLPPDRRLAIVKRAARNLVNVLAPDADNRIAVGLVPWHQAVRLDSDAAADWTTNGWARYPTRRVYDEPYVCRNSGCTPPAAVEQALPGAPESWNGCLDSHRTGATGTRASVPAASTFFTAPSASAFAQRFFPAVLGASYECLAPSLTANLGQICYHDGTGYVGADAFPPHDPLYYDCTRDKTPAIVPLSTDGDAMRRAIDSLVPFGNRTYSALGVLWGQRLLDPSWRGTWGGDVHPVDPDDPASDGLRKAIVLLTDGADNFCGGMNPTCANSELGFSRTDACTAAKAAGTEIFVIAAMHPDEVSQALGESLRACSSQSDNPDGSYVFLNNATPESLEAAFADIASQLMTTRRIE